MPTLADKFRGCLLGLAVGDGLGANFEGALPQHIHELFAAPLEIIRQPPREDLYYTDDTQMAIGVAETLLARGRIEQAALCRAFVANYVPGRGYGRGARAVIEAMQAGEDHQRVAETYFPGGSYGNGAAMRAAPLGAFFHRDLDRVWEEARLSSLPTHTHELGYQGAQLVALAAALCIGRDSFDHDAFFAELLRRPLAPELARRMQQAAQAQSPADLPPLGNGIAALDSAPTAIACFAVAPYSYEHTIANAIWLGGDTDTIAAMAGALSGAFLGVDAIPRRLARMLEDHLKGRSYLLTLADRLLAAAEA